MSKEIESNIMDFIEKKLRFKIDDIQSIKRGLLNLKWKIKTDRGSFFVKQYNERRYPPDKLERVKKSLYYQNKLHHLGIKCPKLYPYQNEYLLNCEKAQFIITNFEQGTLIKPGKINEEQAFHLGFETAQLHQYLQLEELSYVSWNVPTNEILLEKWKENKQEENDILLKQKQILKEIDLSIFNNLKPSIAHNDLWCDNVLFNHDQVSAILDFDRLNTSYQTLDIGRAILSFCLNHNHLRKNEVHAFLNGYNENMNLTIKDLILSLKLCYICESLVWLGGNIVINDGPPERFKEEMIFITNNWEHLEEVVF